MSDKILNILALYETNCSGETVATENIIKQLRTHKEINVYNFAREPLTNTSSYGYLSWVSGSIFFWLKILLMHNCIDWVYTTTYTAGMSTLLLKPWFKYKLCFHYHGNRIPEYPAPGLPFLTQLTQKCKHEIILYLHRAIFFGVDVVVVPSLFTENYLLRQFPQLKNKKVSVIANGVNIHQFTPVATIQKNSLKKQYAIAKNSTVITFVGILAKRKRIGMLLSAFAKFKSQINDAQVVLAVRSPVTNEEKQYLLYLKTLINQLHLSARVRWIWNAEKISEIYQISDLVVLPSNLEHFPLVMLETLSSGILFLGSNIPPMTQILRQVDKRLISRVKNPKILAKDMITLLNFSPQEKLQIKRKARMMLIKKYTWEKIGREIRSLLHY